MADSPADVPKIDKGTISFAQLDQPTQDRLVRNELVIYTVLAVVALTLVATLVGAIAIVIDQLHFNNEVYRDGSVTHTKTVIQTQTVMEQPIFFPNMKPTGN